MTCASVVAILYEPSIGEFVKKERDGLNFEYVTLVMQNKM